MVEIMASDFEWDENKNRENQRKHGMALDEAQEAFFDPNRFVAIDVAHSTERETRYYCFGKVDGEVITVRFTRRGNIIRIIGAGHWRKGRKIYETQKS
jgi:uncharacterized DUF497 family protein